MDKKIKIIRTATVPGSLGLLKGQLKFLNRTYEIKAVSSGGTRLNEIAVSEGIEVIPIHMNRRISFFSDIISLFKLYQFLRKEKPKIIHSITPKAGLLTMLAGKLAGVPIRMHTFTGLIFPSRSGIMQQLLIKMDQLLCWSATNVYPEGNGVKCDLINFKITKKSLKVLGNGNINGIDLNHFCQDQISENEQVVLKNSLNIKENDFVFVFVGRLVTDKGVNELVKAFVQLNRSNVKLLLVGSFESDLDPLNAETLNFLKTNSNILTVGFQKNVRLYLSISNVLVLASYREGFPNVVLQAGAMDLPCIVTNINGCNEIIKQNINGVIIKVKDSDEILKNMQILLDNKNYYNKLKQNARSMISSRYEQQLIWDAILQEYEYLINKNNE